jgi:hypothetical protein
MMMRSARIVRYFAVGVRADQPAGSQLSKSRYIILYYNINGKWIVLTVCVTGR